MVSLESFESQRMGSYGNYASWNGKHSKNQRELKMHASVLQIMVHILQTEVCSFPVLVFYTDD